MEELRIFYPKNSKEMGLLLSTLSILFMFLFKATLKGHYPKVWLEYKC